MAHPLLQLSSPPSLVDGKMAIDVNVDVDWGPHMVVPRVADETSDRA